MQIARSLTDSSSGTPDLQRLVQDPVQQHQQQQGQAQLAAHGAEASLEIRRLQKILQKFSQLDSAMLMLTETWEVLGNTIRITIRSMILLHLGIPLTILLTKSMRQYLLGSQCMQERQLMAAAATPQPGWGQQQQLAWRRQWR
jgi:hypothetical protein